MAAQDSASAARTTFAVKQVDDRVIYIDGGKNDGLAAGMTLNIKRARVLAGAGDGEFKGSVIIAKLTIVSVSSTSAQCEVRTQSGDVRRGDIATLVVVAHDKNTRTPNFPVTPLLQDGRNAVFKAPLVEMDQETAKTTSAPAPVKAAPAPTPADGQISLADAAREIARRKREKNSPATATAAKQPAAPASSPVANPTVAAKPPANPGPPTATVAADKKPAANPANRDAGVSVANATPPQPPAPANVTPPSPIAPITAAAASKTAPAPASSAESAPSTIASAVTKRPVAAPAPVATAQPPASPSNSANSTAKPALETRAAVATPSSPEVPVAEPEAVPAAVSGMAATSAALKTDFKVKYVAEDAVYIDGGKSAGLAEGMVLALKHAGDPAANGSDLANRPVVAEVAVVSVSNTSAVCEVRTKNADIQRGDVAQLSQGDQDKLVEMRTLGPTRKYPQVIAFSEGDPLDEEVRASVPKPPLPEVNRARGRIGLDYTYISSRGSTVINSSQTGGVVRADITRIGGSYWNLNGYWRGRLNIRSASTTSPAPQSVFDLVNRTYTIGLTYVNPQSHWTAGVGRLYLPWAPSLDTIDGGYGGLKLGKHTTIGIFGGTTPDPASFDYNQDRRLAGSFVAFEGGSFDSVRFTSTEGIAVSAIEWREDRQFIFSENGLFYKRFLSIYHSAQADKQRLPTGGTTDGLSRSFATLRIQPFSRLSFDVNHNYFRDVPTFDANLVGTGLLDKFLFQGLSAGARVELPGRISVYNNFGQSSKSGDAKSSLNQLYGVTVAKLWFTGIRGDVRYSKFTSSFGQGNYRAASVSRSFAEAVRIEVTAGRQDFVSSLGVATNYKLLGSTIDLNLGGHYFLESGFNMQRSSQQNFDQWLMTMGYRFDSGRRK
ncbi:MAG: hypothetical protein LAO20_07515 [Acidobacteriia bacterium]|nr:hypothetical protein [Terriglobia bacterium]